MSSSEDPCPACKWTSDQQRRCAYESSVRLFHGASNRGYWSLGSKFFFLKERGKYPPSHEVINTHFIKENTTVPDPTSVQEWTKGDKYFQIVERVPGVPLKEIRSSIPQPDRETLALFMANQFGVLIFFHNEEFGDTHGLLSTADELWDVFAKSLSAKVPEVVRLRLRDGMPPPHP
ncbi:hypothetical protein N7453_006757 [Penicillium expansum]|nr:hypothetical protein N7453_006757 [Penicillium expansum]